jgi:hypothetical protein
MTRNMGGLDRALRLIAALALIPAWLLTTILWQELVLGALIVVLLVTSATGFCPGYLPFGISTVRGDKKPSRPATVAH